MTLDSEPSLFGKGVVALVIASLGIAALVNITTGNVPHPFAFSLVLVGFVLFLVAKLSVVGRKKWISFGTGLMSPSMADLYRIGYWLMAVGLLATFTV